MQPTYSLSDLVSLLQSKPAQGYKFYGVLLYSPLNSLNERLHKYVVSHWGSLNDLTGPQTLILAVENIDRGQPIEAFQQDQIYSIARELGADVAAVPCLVLFTEPVLRRDTLVLSFRQMLPDRVEDHHLTILFQLLQSILDSHLGAPLQDRLSLVQAEIEQEWFHESAARPRSSPPTGWIVPSLANGATILESIEKIAALISRLFGTVD